MLSYISILVLISSLCQVNGQDPEPCNFPCSWQQAGNFTTYNADFYAGEFSPAYPIESGKSKVAFSTENPSEVSFWGLTFVCHEIADQFIILRNGENAEYYCIQTKEISDEPLQFQWTFPDFVSSSSDKCLICRKPDLMSSILFLRAESAGDVPATQPFHPPTCTTPVECTECGSCDLCTEAEMTPLNFECPTPSGTTTTPTTDSSTPAGTTTPPPTDSPPNCGKSRGKSHGKSHEKCQGKSRGKSHE